MPWAEAPPFFSLGARRSRPPVGAEAYGVDLEMKLEEDITPVQLSVDMAVPLALFMTVR
jgi:hypothetical protein